MSWLASGYLSHPDRTESEMQAALETFLAESKALVGGLPPASLTVASGVIAPSTPAASVDTQGGAATDELDRIQTDNVKDGHVLVLWGANAARKTTVRHMQGGVGQISLAGGRNYELTPDRTLWLLRNGTVWREIMATPLDSAASDHGAQVFTASGTFTIPATSVYVSLIGGGGGGAGGLANWGSAGAAGSPGGASSFGSHVSSSGGAGAAAVSPVVISDGLYWFRGGRGGSPYGRTGQNSYTSVRGDGGEAVPSPFGSYGRGGRGGNGGVVNPADPNKKAGSGGGSGSISADAVFKQLVTGLTPGGTVSVTVGAGGAGGAGGTGDWSGGSGENGQAGSAGIVIVEW